MKLALAQRLFQLSGGPMAAEGMKGKIDERRARRAREIRKRSRKSA